MRYLPVLILSLFCSSLCAAAAPHCAASAVLPAGFHIIEAAECFSADVAEALVPDNGALGDYLDRFPDTPTSAAYRYWCYLRAEQFLPALLTLVELVNGAPSSAPAEQFRDEIAFLVINGIKRVPREVDLFARSGTLSTGELSERFFFILDQVVSLYAEGRSGSRRDSWLVFRSLALFFSSSSGPAAAADPFFRAQYERYHALWKEGVLLPYLAFFAFFTAGDRTFLPAEPTYSDKLASLVPLPKKAQDRDRERDAVGNIVRLMGRFSLDNIARLPDMEFIATDDADGWRRMNGALSDDNQRCALFDERQAMFAPHRDDLFEPFVHNRALSLMEGCDPRHDLPFRIKGEKIYLAEQDRWLRDVAVVYYLIARGDYSYREASGLLSGAMIAAVTRYEQEAGNSSPFGRALRYAFHTDRLANFRDALFLYRRYGDEASVFNREKTTETVEFVTSFFFGLREEEK